MRLIQIVSFLFALHCTLSAIEPDWFTDVRGNNSGHTTCQFLTLPHSAVSLATGLAASGGNRDATDIPFFTANTALADRYRFSITHLEWFMGLRKEYLGAYFPVLDVGTFGVYSQLFTPGPIRHARTIDETPSDPKIYELSIGVTFARQIILNQLSAGGGIAFLESHLDNSIARTAIGNVDILYSPITRLSAHLYGANIGKSITYDNAYESLPTELGLSVQYYPLSKPFIDRTHLNLKVSIGARKIADNPVISGLSADFSVMETFSLRTGYEYTYGNDFSVEGLGAGVSLQLGKYALDGSWRYESQDLGFVWAATLRMQLEEIIPKTADQYYEIAVKHYKKKRTLLCEYFAKKALAKDPNLWKAHALLSKLRSDMLRQNNLEVGIIYAGNMRGNFAIPVERSMPGGLARLTTVIKNLQSQFFTSVTISTGNVCSAISDTDRIAISGTYFNRISPDILAAGKSEIQSNPDKLLYHMKLTTDKKFILNNANFPNVSVITKQIIEKNSYRFFVTSVVNALQFRDSITQKQLKPLISSELLSSDALQCDAKIVIVDDTWANIRNNAAIYKGFDILICSSLDQPFQTAMKLDSLVVLSAGTDCMYAGNLILRFDDNRKLLGTENRLYPLSDDIKQDSVVADAMRKVTLQQGGTDSTAQQYVLKSSSPDGVFPFLSNRNGTDQLFLKVFVQRGEFPISSIDQTAYNPVVSFSTSSIAYILKTDTLNRFVISTLSSGTPMVSPDSMNVRRIAVSPDGKWLYVSAHIDNNSYSDILRRRFDGGPYYSVIQSDSIDEQDIAIAPNENLIVYSAAKARMYHQLYFADMTGQKPMLITNVKADHFVPQFSPDGRRIAYLSDRSNFGGKLDLWVFDRDKAAHAQITSHSNVKEFCWLDDSRTLCFSSGVNVFSLYKVDINNSRYAQLITRDSTVLFNERSPETLRDSTTETIIYTREYRDGTRKIFQVNTDGTNEKRIVNSNGNDWLPSYRK
jgi:hypothetical protein